jgi:hypothetical protein
MYRASTAIFSGEQRERKFRKGLDGNTFTSGGGGGAKQRGADFPLVLVTAFIYSTHGGALPMVLLKALS